MFYKNTKADVLFISESFLFKAPGTVPAATLAAITPPFMVLLGKHHEPLFVHIKVAFP
jgi:hypothetical protein